MMVLVDCLENGSVKQEMAGMEERKVMYEK